MDTNRTSFLFKCDGEFNILHTFWYHPVHLLSPYQKTLAVLFSPADMERIAGMAEKALSGKGAIFCEGGFSTVNPAADVCLCMTATGNAILLHGHDDYLRDDNPLAAPLRDTIHRFMETLKAADTDFMTGSETVIREQFEKIQKLNSDLVNTQRQLKKANSMLNRLNQDLNNRLVRDALTGLVSRYQYRQEIESAISRAPEKRGIFAFVDLDDFKRINDTYGHAAGDQYLKEFADRLGRLPFDNLICMRIAGDEFGIYIHGYDTVEKADIQFIWDRMKDVVMGRPIRLGDVEEKVFCSAGMAVYGRDTQNVYELIECADFAMYEAKKSGKNSFSEFDPERYRKAKASPD